MTEHPQGCERDRHGSVEEGTIAWLRRPTLPWGEQVKASRIIELTIQHHTLDHAGETIHIRALLQGNDDRDHQVPGREEEAA